MSTAIALSEVGVIALCFLPPLSGVENAGSRNVLFVVPLLSSFSFSEESLVSSFSKKSSESSLLAGESLMAFVPNPTSLGVPFSSTLIGLSRLSFASPAPPLTLARSSSVRSKSFLPPLVSLSFAFPPPVSSFGA